eukprot:m.17157 g.17157  ORF g.17157 m.17157 type:complete len:299 (+) comp11156_c0_seq1:384-1280(+)
MSGSCPAREASPQGTNTPANKKRASDADANNTGVTDPRHNLPTTPGPQSSETTASRGACSMTPTRKRQRCLSDTDEGLSSTASGASTTDPSANSTRRVLFNSKHASDKQPSTQADTLSVSNDSADGGDSTAAGSGVDPRARTMNGSSDATSTQSVAEVNAAMPPLEHRVVTENGDVGRALILVSRCTRVNTGSTLGADSHEATNLHAPVRLAHPLDRLHHTTAQGDAYQVPDTSQGDADDISAASGGVIWVGNSWVLLSTFMVPTVLVSCANGDKPRMHDDHDHTVPDIPATDTATAS